MPTVELSFTALPAHVRTARLVAATVARRAGVDAETLDELRLAVGEACSRAVHLHRRHCPDRPVSVALTDGDGFFQVVVTDEAPVEPGAGEGFGALADVADLIDAEAVPPSVGLAVINGLVDDVVLEPGETSGLAVRMSWPTA